MAIDIEHRPEAVGEGQGFYLTQDDRDEAAERYAREHFMSEAAERVFDYGLHYGDAGIDPYLKSVDAAEMPAEEIADSIEAARKHPENIYPALFGQYFHRAVGRVLKETSQPRFGTPPGFEDSIFQALEYNPETLQKLLPDGLFEQEQYDGMQAIIKRIHEDSMKVVDRIRGYFPDHARFFPASFVANMWQENQIQLTVNDELAQQYLESHPLWGVIKTFDQLAAQITHNVDFRVPSDWILEEPLFVNTPIREENLFFFGHIYPEAHTELTLAQLSEYVQNWKQFIPQFLDTAMGKTIETMVNLQGYMTLDLDQGLRYARRGMPVIPLEQTQSVSLEGSDPMKNHLYIRQNDKEAYWILRGYLQLLRKIGLSNQYGNRSYTYTDHEKRVMKAYRDLRRAGRILSFSEGHTPLASIEDGDRRKVGNLQSRPDSLVAYTDVPGDREAQEILDKYILLVDGRAMLDIANMTREDRNTALNFLRFVVGGKIHVGVIELKTLLYGTRLFYDYHAEDYVETKSELTKPLLGKFNRQLAAGVWSWFSTFVPLLRDSEQPDERELFDAIARFTTLPELKRLYGKKDLGAQDDGEYRKIFKNKNLRGFINAISRAAMDTQLLVERVPWFKQILARDGYKVPATLLVTDYVIDEVNGPMKVIVIPASENEHHDLLATEWVHGERIANRHFLEQQVRESVLLYFKKSKVLKEVAAILAEREREAQEAEE